MMYSHKPSRVFPAPIRKNGLQERSDVGRSRGATFSAPRAQGHDCKVWFTQGPRYDSINYSSYADSTSTCCCEIPTLLTHQQKKRRYPTARKIRKVQVAVKETIWLQKSLMWNNRVFWAWNGVISGLLRSSRRAWAPALVIQITLFYSIHLPKMFVPGYVQTVTLHHLKQL